MQVDLLRRKEVNYFYASDQFKGMRQDCTVQHLRNALSAGIYEAHARCALEHGDTAEYNQCQAQLFQHYQAGISGAQQEFTAYRLLYQSVHAGRGNHAGVLSCLQSILLEVVPTPLAGLACMRNGTNLIERSLSCSAEDRDCTHIMSFKE